MSLSKLLSLSILLLTTRRGSSVAAFVNNRTICTSEASYGTSGSLSVDGKPWTTISKMSECLDPVPVKKGDVVRLEVTYDEIAHPL
jgi:hypothetical protein